MTLRIGSMCTGYGGLDAAVVEVLGGSVAWHSELDPDASKVLAHHWPDVPNVGDLTGVDWSTVEPVDIVCAGFPCQDISYAGRGAGIKEGTRSGLWHTIADALGVLRPRLVVLENVAAIVARRPGLDVVLGDLAALGFDAEWTCVRASDVGAPHPRRRWFLIAQGGTPAADSDGEHERSVATGAGRGEPQAQARGGRASAADAAGHGRREGRTESAGQQRRPDASLGGGAPAADSDRDAVRQQPVAESGSGSAAIAGLAGLEWGPYGPAVRRWERVTGNPAPRATEPGRTGERLSPRFVEWPMGLEPGFVTGVPGISRNAQLRILGNGVVPQQGAHALRILMAYLKEATA